MMGLSETAPMSGWPTPKVPTGGANSKREQRGAGGADLQEAVTLASWPTPRQEDSEKTGAHNGKADTLHSATQLAGWKTPHASDGEGGTMEIRPNTAGHYKLRYQAELAGWATPRVTNNCGCPSPDVTGRGSRLEDQAALTVPFPPWVTPQAKDYRSGMESRWNDKNHAVSLNDQVKVAASAVPFPPWLTPSANEDAAGNPGAKMQPMLGSQAKLATSGQTQSPSPAATTASGVLNPAFSRWLQSFLVVWDTAAILAYRRMQTTRRKRVSCV